MTKADIGLIGLAVMGQNLVLNMDDNGYTVAVYNRTTSKVDDFLAQGAKGTKVIGTKSLEEFFAALKRPRKVMLMVKAGDAVDVFIDLCLPFLEEGDLVIDGGNSHYEDTQRRWLKLKAKGLLYLGAGVSGGEEGARNGPSIMPGGESTGWSAIKPIFQKIAAKSEEGDACCEWVGEGGSGHYVKMIHNGIEYGDMQLICEVYALMKGLLNFDVDQLAKTFGKWNEGKLNSYLVEITSEIFSHRQPDGSPTVDQILDVAGQKGTGKWTGIDSLELGMPVTLISEAVYARCLSALKEERVKAAKVLVGPETKFDGDPTQFVKDLGDALYASKIVSYAQGFMLMKEAAKERGWKLNFGDLALMWRGGCIIRSRFLGKIKEAFDADPDLDNLLVTDYFQKELAEAQQGWRRVVATAALQGVSIPCLSTALAFYDGYRSEYLPANLLQAQRDFFGAHTYEKVNSPRGKFFHTDWIGSGGLVSSSTYNV